jgi:hypothetical protein
VFFEMKRAAMIMFIPGMCAARNCFPAHVALPLAAAVADCKFILREGAAGHFAAFGLLNLPACVGNTSAGDHTCVFYADSIIPNVSIVDQRFNSLVALLQKVCAITPRANEAASEALSFDASRLKLHAWRRAEYSQQPVGSNNCALYSCVFAKKFMECDYLNCDSVRCLCV